VVSRIKHCIVCGVPITMDGDDFCTDQCVEIFRSFKSDSNLRTINGFCAICGKPHELKKGKNDVVWHRHIECYDPNNRHLSIEEKEQKRKELEDKLRLRELEKEQKRKEEEEALNKFKDKSSFLLSKKKLFDEDTHMLICPTCATYSVHYHQKTDKWICDFCDSYIKPYQSLIIFDLDFSDQDKYKIYKHYGIEALIYLSDFTWDEAQCFVAHFFEDSCTSKGDSCPYSYLFEEINGSKQIESIDNQFLNWKEKYISLKDETETLLNTIENNNFVPDEVKKAFNTDVLSIKRDLSDLIEGLDEFVISIADDSLSKNQKVYLKENDENLLAVLDEGDMEGFCWNDAKKGEFVGICFFPPNSYYEMKQIFEDLKNNYEKEPQNYFHKKLHEAVLPYLEKQTMDLILENGSFLQNDLWKELEIDSRKCSRVVQSLLSKELIAREEVVSNGARTYRLKLNI
jgi:DNA-binding MarR family transcriptional regulator